MKKVLLFFVAATILLLNLQSCDNNASIEPIEEYVELKLKPKGVDITVTPMSRASSSDLYCVGIYKDGDGASGLEYASWLTDDITSEKFILRKGQKYQCKVIYFPNGKEVLEDYTTGSVYPICGEPHKTPQLSDGIIYDTKYGWGNVILGAAMKKGNAKSGMSASGYFFNDVVRYHGGTVIDAQSDLEAEINLYLQMYELSVEVKNLKEGYIEIKGLQNVGWGDAENNNTIRLTPENPSIATKRVYDDVPYDFAKYDSDFKNYEGGANFILYYTDAQGKTITIDKVEHSIKRIHRLNISFDIQEFLESINAGITANPIENEDWIDENYDI